MQGILTAVASMGGNNSIKGLVTPDDIIFNRVTITNINFFDFTNGNSTVISIRENVASWYYALRILAIAVLLVVLIYIGIRMALSSVASEQAKYKEMLKNWAVSFALVFVLHYFAVFIIQVNNSLIDTLSNANSSNSGILGSLATSLQLEMLDPRIIKSVAAIIIYFMLVGMTFAFFTSYIKRFLTIGFLILISPLITITYSIDKMGDNKSQALNTWMKEFIYNILIQPFHAIIYMVFVKEAINMLALNTFSTVAGAVFAILCMKFVWDAEKIVKHIFGIGQAHSLVETVASLAAVGVVSKVAIGAAGANNSSESSGNSGSSGSSSKSTGKVSGSTGASGQSGAKAKSNSGFKQNLMKNKAVQNATQKMNDLGQKYNDKMDELSKSDKTIDKVGATAMKGAKKAGGAVLNTGKVLAENAGGLAIGTAAWALAAGANDKGAFNYGVTAFDTVKTIKDSKKGDKKTQEKIKETESETAEKYEKYAKNKYGKDYTKDPNEQEKMKKDFAKLLDTDLDVFERRIQMILNDMYNKNNWGSLSEDELNERVNNIYETANNLDLKNPPQGMPTDVINLARSIQDKNMAQILQSQKSLYKEAGYTNYREDMNGWMEDFLAGKFED